ncbi:hypothetical protein TNCV_955881 [Trichonephila clavipes]|nr:hypothetical protein TNCV_955881 [Trichonephila clavipes]
MIYGTCRGLDVITGVEESDDGCSCRFLRENVIRVGVFAGGFCATQLLERMHFGWLKRSDLRNSGWDAKRPCREVAYGKDKR